MTEYLLLGMWLSQPLPPPPTLEKVLGYSSDTTVCQFNDMRIEIKEAPYRPRLSGMSDRDYCANIRCVRDTGEGCW